MFINSNDDSTLGGDWQKVVDLEVSPAFGLPLVEDLPDPAPLEKLRDQEFIQTISRMVSEIIRCAVVRDALEMIRRLRLVKTLKASDAGTYRIYDRLINLLRFVSLYAQKPQQVKNLLSSGLLAALFAGVDVKDGLEFYFKDEKLEGIDKQQRREFVYALENNQERLGQQNFTLGEEPKKFPSIAQNWLKAYNLSQPVYMERSKFNQINFLNSNLTVKILSPKEKKALEQVLEIYDWLLFPPPAIAVADEQKISEYINQQNLVLPKDFKLPSFAKASEDLRPDLPRLSSAEAGQPSAVVPVVSKVAAPPIPGIRPLPTDAGWPSEAPLAKGLKLGEGMNYESGIMNQARQTKPPVPTAPKLRPDIDRKLEELKRKAERKNNP